MGDTVIVTEEEAKPKPEVVFVVPEKTPPKPEVVVEKTTVTETRRID